MNKTCDELHFNYSDSSAPVDTQVQLALKAVPVEPVKEPALFKGPPPALMPVMLPPPTLVCQMPKPFKPPPPQAPGARAEDAPCRLHMSVECAFRALVCVPAHVPVQSVSSILFS